MKAQSRFTKTLVEIEELGLQVNNLFQLEDGTWRANVRSVDLLPDGLNREYYPIARAADPVSALVGAFEIASEKIRKEKKRKERRTKLPRRRISEGRRL